MSGNGKGKTSGEKSIKEQAVQHYKKELAVSKLPAVLSSYMRTDSLPDEYKGIDPYVAGVRRQLITEAGGDLSQLQMIVLDGICETLILSKYIATYIGEDIDAEVVATNKFGTKYVSDVVLKGFIGLQTLLDKKIKQFRELIDVEKQDEEEAGYLRAVMGKVKPPGRVKTGR